MNDKKNQAPEPKDAQQKDPTQGATAEASAVESKEKEKAAPEKAAPEKASLEKDSLKNQTQVKTPAPKAGVGKAAFSFLTLLVLLLIGGLGAAGWWGYEEWTRFQAEKNQLHTLVLNLQAEQGQLQRNLGNKLEPAALAPLQARLRELDQLREQQEKQLALLHEQDQRLAAYRQQVVEPKPDEWQLAEVEYLLRLASQRLHLEEDVQGALALYRAASERLQAAQIPGTLAVRQAVTEDIAALEALDPIDRVALALRLQGLAKQSMQLRLRALSEAPRLNPEARFMPGVDQAWYTNLWAEIKSLIVITQHDQRIEPLPSPEDEHLLREQIASLLQQAAWAVLQGEEGLYQNSLQAVLDRLTFFDEQLMQHQQLKQAVRALQGQAVRQTFPSVEAGLDRLQGFIREHYRRALPVSREAN